MRKFFSGRSTGSAYLLELVLVVVGISASFWIENYREQLGDRSTEQEYLRGLREDLARDTLSLQEMLLAQQNRASACIRLLQGPDPSFLGSDSGRLQIFRIANLSQVVRHTNTLREMEGSGQFRLIRSRTIRSQLLEQENLYESLIRLQDHQRYDLYEHLYPIFFVELDFSAMMSRGAPPTAEAARRSGLSLYNALQRNQKLRNMLVIIGYNAELSRVQYTRTLEHTRTLIREIEAVLPG